MRDLDYRPDAAVCMSYDHAARVWVLSCSVCPWTRVTPNDEHARILVESHGQGHGFRLDPRP